MRLLDNRYKLPINWYKEGDNIECIARYLYAYNIPDGNLAIYATVDNSRNYDGPIFAGRAIVYALAEGVDAVSRDAFVKELKSRVKSYCLEGGAGNKYKVLDKYIKELADANF